MIIKLRRLMNKNILARGASKHDTIRLSRRLTHVGMRRQAPEGVHCVEIDGHHATGALRVARRSFIIFYMDKS